jgi:hypothetical protein
MKCVKPCLSSVQQEVLQEIINLPGIGCLKDVSLLNDRQSRVIKELQDLGFASVYKKRQKFMVLMSA